jgi:5-methylcytosine-specific restriction endonuclease McrBC regulatory subunit McrC
LPKYGKEMLDSLLPLAFGIYLDRFEDSLDLSDTSFLLDEAIAWLFINCYRQTISRNIRWDYQRVSERSVVSTGTLDVQRSLMALTTGAGDFTWNRSHLTKDTGLNFFVRRVFETLHRSLRVSRLAKSELASCADEVCSHFMLRNFSVRELLEALDRTTIHYKPFLELAERMSLGRSVVSGGQQSVAFLIRTWDVFERAVRSGIRECLRGTPWSVNESGAMGLSSTITGSNTLKPDIVIYAPTDGIRAIADIKYEDSTLNELKRDNLFQLNTYLNGYELSHGCLIYPTSGAFGKSEFSLRWGKSIAIYQLPVNSRSAFISGIKELLRTEVLSRGHKSSVESGRL